MKRTKKKARHNFDFVVRRGKRNAQARPTDLHALPDSRAGKGIPHEPLSHQAEADRDGTRTLPDGTANQDLVPESANEAEKGVKGSQRDQRASQTRARGARYDEETAGGETGQVTAGAAERRPSASAAASRKRPGKNAKRSSEGSQ